MVFLTSRSAVTDRVGPNWTPPELASTAGSSCVVGKTLSFYKQFRSKIGLISDEISNLRLSPAPNDVGFFHVRQQA